MARIGQKRHPITIKKNSGEGTYGTRGQLTDDWTRFAGSHASIVTLSGSELEQARQLYAKATHRLEMRWIKGINTRHQVIFFDVVADANRTLHIGHIDNVDQRRREMVLLCSGDK